MKDWMAQAACRSIPTETMYPAPGDTVTMRRAVSTCAGCPVRADCLSHALLEGEDHGIWGGTTARQRSRLARRLRAGTAVEEVVRYAFRFPVGA
jgi:WhiB family redox-sensing transcriptional regulator